MVREEGEDRGSWDLDGKGRGRGQRDLGSRW